jgi:hypothetical protein
VKSSGRRSWSSPGPAALVALVALGLAVGALPLAAVATSPASAGLKAITEMTSTTSSLRVGADGKPVAAKQAVDATAGTLGSSDLMGTPADKTVLRSDQVLRETNTGGVAAGNATTVAAYGLNDAMTAASSSPPESPLPARATIDHDYASVHGHFLDATHEGVLDFKESVAGGDGLFSLTSPNHAAEAWSYADVATDPLPGTTYVILQGTTALTNTGVAASGALSVQARSETIFPAASQLWTVVDSGHGDGTFSLVSRSDGLCLAVSGQKATVDACEDDVTRHWSAKDNGNTTNFVFPAGSTDSTSLGSSGGGSVANTLVLNTQQTWEFRVFDEPGGSVPSWSVDRTNGYTANNISAPYDMAAGDLDGLATQDAQVGGLAYHDEAFVAYTDSNDRWAVRVVDYNANPSHLLVTSASASVGFAIPGETVDGTWNPGDLTVAVGDFNGDGKNEIAAAFQNADGNFFFTIWDYVANADGTRSLNLLSPCNVGCYPFGATDNITLQQGYADIAVGDFDGDGKDDIALAYANTVSAGRQVNVGTWSLNADLSTRSVSIITSPMPNGYLPPSLTNDAGRTSSGIRMEAGNLYANPGGGFGPQRSELAVAWSAYSVGNKVYNPWTTKDEHPYTITPQFNVYSMATSDCNATDTTCASAITATNGNGNPTALFPHNASQIAYRDFGTGYDIPPVSLAVGAFGGTGATDPPVDGLVASAWLEWNANPSDFSDSTHAKYYTQQSIVVPWVSGDATLTKWTTTDSQTTTGDTDNSNPGNANWILQRYTAYDRQGLSTVLGAPTVLDLEQNVKENVVAAEPPTQVDWLNGAWSNVSATSNFYLQTKTSSGTAFTSQTTNQNSWQNGVHEGVDVKAKWKDTLFPAVGSSGYVDVNQKFSKAWSGLTQTSSNASASWSTSAEAQTSQDDAFSYSADDTLLYRYPVVGSSGTVNGSGTCTSGCRVFYDVYVPKGSVHFANVPGKSTSLFQPSWQNMNALSYPAIDGGADNPVPMPDLGGYTYTDANGNVQTVQKPLYNAVNTVGGNSGNVTMDFSTAAGSGTSTTHARTWTVGADVTVSGKVSVGVPGDNGSLAVTASAGFDVSKSTNDTQTGTSGTSSAQQFTLNVPIKDPGQGYEVGTAYYYSLDGAAKVVHGVDLTSDQQGRGWWITNYGQTPNPALNLPGRIELAYDTNNYFYDSPLWLTAPQRQLIRGFQALQAGDDATGLPTAGTPYTVNPQTGQQITFQVPVSNYSLKAMAAGTSATWYSVAVDDNDIDVTGTAAKIGTSTVPAIGAQGTVLVQSPTWTAPSESTMQQYRIFVRLDEAGTAADLHPLAGTACPATALEPNNNNGPTPALYDVMLAKQTADPLGCGQDNQGYGLVTVSPVAAASAGAERHATAADPAHAKLDGGGLVDGDADHLHLTERSAVPTVPFGQRITGLVHASASLQTDDQPIVAIYDGPVRDGKIIGVTRMNGIDDETGGHVAFSWTPDKPGVHELHQVLLGTHATGEDDEQIMRVRVGDQPKPFMVTARASAALVATGTTFTISGTTSPVVGTAVYRTVQLQRLDGKAWTKVDEQETSSTGAYAFDVTAGAAGTSSYRVLKLATPGRTQAASAPVPVVVTASGGNPVTVTVAAEPTAADTGQRVTFTGTVTPPQARARDRKVDLQVQSGSRWRTVAKGSTTATGAYTLTTTPQKQGGFSYRVTQRAAGGLPATSSAPLLITVTRQYVVTAKINHAKIRIGRSAVVSGKVKPTEAGASSRTISLERRSGSSWETVSTKGTKASGAYRFTIKPAEAGTSRYRVRKDAVGDRRAAYSPIRRLVVTKS